MNILDRLSLSKFRSSFHLNQKMKDYVKDKGIDKIRNDAFDLINKRLRPKDIPNDGKQTPMKQVHPVFIAQHATATCCRSCLYKWHKIEKNKELDDKEVSYIVDIIIKWIEKETD
jgi:hypothetical protein